MISIYEQLKDYEIAKATNAWLALAWTKVAFAEPIGDFAVLAPQDLVVHKSCTPLELEKRPNTLVYQQQRVMALDIPRYWQSLQDVSTLWASINELHPEFIISVRGSTAGIKLTLSHWYEPGTPHYTPAPAELFLSSITAQTWAELPPMLTAAAVWATLWLNARNKHTGAPTSPEVTDFGPFKELWHIPSIVVNARFFNAATSEH